MVRAGIVSNYVFISCHYLHIWAGQSISRYLGGFTIYTSEAPGCNTLTRPEQIEKWLTNFQTEQRYVPTTQLCIISEVIHKILMVIRFKLHKSQLLQVGLLDIKIYEPWPGQYNFFFLVTWYLTQGGVEVLTKLRAGRGEIVDWESRHCSAAPEQCRPRTPPMAAVAAPPA